MRGEELLKQAMLFSIGSAIMNIILDPIFILLLKPYGMGIDGAAYATVASQVAYAMASLWYFKRKSKNVRINTIRINHRSGFFCDADAGDDAGTANRAL